VRDLGQIRQAFADLDSLNRCLHEQAEGGIGGPLHVITDDGNLEDHHVLGCLQDLDGDTSSTVVVRVLCREMLRILCLLTAPQRLMWYLARQLRQIGHNPADWAKSLRDGVVEHRETCGNWNAVVTKCGTVVFPGLRELKREWDERLRAASPEDVPDVTTSGGDHIW